MQKYEYECILIDTRTYIDARTHLPNLHIYAYI